MNACCVTRLLALVVALAGGCQKTTKPAQAPLSEEARARYAELAGLKRSQHPALKAEYEQLLAERSTPRDLERLQPAADRAAASREETAAQRLTKTFPAFTRNALAEQLASVYPARSFAWGPAQLTKAREIRRRYDEARRKFRDDVSAAERSFGLKASDGPLADLSFLEALQIGCRLEGALAADALADGQPDEALASVQVMLQAVALLSHEWNLTCRLAAARLRVEALQALAAVVAHPQATQTTQLRSAELLAQQTANWPLDAQAWIGERASGLIAYELVRNGYYLSLLSREEIAELTKQEILQVTARTAIRNVDGDEAFYLAAMRKLIDACRRPPFERQPVLLELRAQLEALRSTPEYPLVAGQLLLTDFELAMRRVAEDLARCQAWSLAFRTALGPATQEPVTNSLTGLPFQFERTAYGVRVSGVCEPDEPVFVPVRPAIRTARGIGSPTR